MVQYTQMKHNFSYYIGNALILLSLGGFVFVFYPLIRLYIVPPKIHKITQNGIFITIPKIHAESRIIPNVDPWNQTAYTSALKKGVAQAKGTSLPGEKGTIYLFAHSSGPPWELTRYNTMFLRIGELVPGDRIILTRDRKEYEYRVRGKKIIWPTNVSYLKNTKPTQLILQTCTPIGTDFQRLLVFADPITQ